MSRTGEGMTTGIEGAMTETDTTSAGAMTTGVEAMPNPDPKADYKESGVDTKILVTLRMIVQREKRRALMETIRGMLEPVRVERGCLNYRLYEDVEDRNSFLLIEEWETRDDLENHIRTVNQRRLLGLMDLLGEQLELQFNTVSQTAGMDLIENVLRKQRPVRDGAGHGE